MTSIHHSAIDADPRQHLGEAWIDSIDGFEANMISSSWFLTLCGLAAAILVVVRLASSSDKSPAPRPVAHTGPPPSLQEAEPEAIAPKQETSGAKHLLPQPSAAKSLSPDPTVSLEKLSTKIGPKDIEEIESSLRERLALRNYDSSARHFIFLLGEVGNDSSQEVLYQALSAPYPAEREARIDASMLVVAAQAALEEIVGRVGTLGAKQRYVRELERAVQTSESLHAKINASRVLLNHSDNRLATEQRLRVLLGPDFSFVLGIEDRTPGSGD